MEKFMVSESYELKRESPERYLGSDYMYSILDYGRRVYALGDFREKEMCTARARGGFLVPGAIVAFFVPVKVRVVPLP